MPYTHVLDPVARELVVTGADPTDFAETAAAIRWPIGRPDFHSSFAVLADLRAMTWVPSFLEVRDYVELFRSVKAEFRGPIAVVVRGSLRLGVARLLTMQVRFFGVTMYAFDDIDKALTWLREPQAGMTAVR